MKHNMLWSTVCLLGIFVFAFSLKVFGLEGFLMAPDGVRLSYDYAKLTPEKEKGTVIFLHGWGMSYAEWDGVKEKFQDEGWSTMAFDFRGHGASIEAEGRQLNYQEMKSRSQRKKLMTDIVTVRDYASTSKPVWLVGSSLGANYAMKYAAKDKKVAGVILIAPGYDSWKILTKNEIKEYGARPVMLIASRNNPWSYRTSTDLKNRAQGPSMLYTLESGHEVEGIKDKTSLITPMLNFMTEQTPQESHQMQASITIAEEKENIAV